MMAIVFRKSNRGCLSFNSPYGYCTACTGLGTKELFSEEACSACRGKRLNQNALSVKIAEKNIWEVTSLMIAEARDFFAAVEKDVPERDQEIAAPVLKEVKNRLQFMFDVGLHYLTLNRTAGTLSGGEAQRIRLASQVGTRLVGALYVLDEPTIGLHQKDNDQLVSTLRNLCDVGNTIIVVEHDEDTILTSDWVVDIRRRGKAWGEVVYSDCLKNFKSEIRSTKFETNPKFKRRKIDCKIIGDSEKSLTGKYLRGEVKIELPEKRRKVASATPLLKVKGARVHNLKNIDVSIPLRRFVCLTGVSGSGKSTFMHDILYRAVANKLNLFIDPDDTERAAREGRTVGKHKAVLGLEYLDKVIKIDQSPIGRTPRSNPATYTKAFDYIRELYASTPEARMRGFKLGRFSFNVPGGRCENCEGRGLLEIEMHFLPSVEIICDVCKGKRFNQETLNIHYKEKILLKSWK